MKTLLRTVLLHLRRFRRYRIVEIKVQDITDKKVLKVFYIINGKVKVRTKCQ